MKKLESESETLETEVSRFAAISGKPGRYMSMEKGPTALNKPSVRSKTNLFFCCIFHKTKMANVRATLKIEISY